MQLSKCVVHSMSRRIYQQDSSQVSQEPEPAMAGVQENPAIKLFLYGQAKPVAPQIRRRLEGFPGVTIVGESTYASHAVAMLKCVHLQLVIVECEEQTGDGLEAIRRIKSELPSLPIMVVSSNKWGGYAQSCLRAGALGYCLHGTSFSRLVLAINSVAEGAGWIDPQISTTVLCPTVLQCDRKSGGSASRDLPLSDRELQVLQLIAEGMANHEIAAKLVVSPETVKTHVKRIMEKLAASDRTQAVVMALRGGLLY